MTGSKEARVTPRSLTWTVGVMHALHGNTDYRRTGKLGRMSDGFMDEVPLLSNGQVSVS